MASWLTDEVLLLGSAFHFCNALFLICFDFIFRFALLYYFACRIEGQTREIFSWPFIKSKNNGLGGETGGPFFKQKSDLIWFLTFYYCFFFISLSPSTENHLHT